MGLSLGKPSLSQSPGANHELHEEEAEDEPLIEGVCVGTTGLWYVAWAPNLLHAQDIRTSRMLQALAGPGGTGLEGLPGGGWVLGCRVFKGCRLWGAPQPLPPFLKARTLLGTLGS